MEAELDEVRERIARSLVATLGPMLQPHAAQRLYVVALTTDSDVITVRLTAHTEEALTELLDDNDNADYYRWWPDEWEMADDDIVPADGVEPLAACSRALYDLNEAEEDHGLWITRGRALLDSALGDPRVAKRLAEINPDWRPVYFVTDTDGELSRTVESIDALNAGAPLVAAARAYFAEED